MAAFFGASRFAVCLNCHQEVDNPTDKGYRKRWNRELRKREANASDPIFRGMFPGVMRPTRYGSN